VQKKYETTAPMVKDKIIWKDRENSLLLRFKSKAIKFIVKRKRMAMGT